MTTHMKDLEGQTFDRWTVISLGPRTDKGAIQWLCRCECGTLRLVRSSNLQQGKSRSCGCLVADVQRARITKYPEWPTRTGASSYEVEKDGKKQSLKQWSKELDISLPVLIARWNRGWADNEILKPTTRQLEAKFKIPDQFIEEEDDEAETSPPS